MRDSLAAMRRRLSALVGLLASGLLLSGCVVFYVVPTAEQQDLVGKVRLTVTVCASDDGVDGVPSNEDHPGCSDQGNSGLEATPLPGQSGDPEQPLLTQILFGLRVPDGTAVPETLSATPAPAPPAAGPVTLRRSPQYAAVLQGASPAAAGSVWIGFISDPYAYDNGTDGVAAQSAPMSIDLGLPQMADGSPFFGPLRVRPAVGMRVVNDTLPADRPIDCGDDPFRQWPRGFLVIPQIVCIDSPAPGAEYNQIGFDLSYPTRDFGIVAGNATASPGQTVSLPFGVRGAGALPPGLTASLTAGTTLPGVGAAPSVPSAPLSNGSDTRVTVPVTIPADAAAGTYDVVLTGRLENGQERRGVAQLTVRARPTVADTTRPALSAATIKPMAFKAATTRKPRRGADVSYTLSEAASVRVAVERCSKYAKPKGKKRTKGRRAAADTAARKRKAAVKRGRCLRFAVITGAQAKSGKAGANSFRFDGRVGGKSLKAGSHRLALTPTDAAGNRGAAVRVAFAIKR